MRAGNGLSPRMRDQFIWNELSPRSSSRHDLLNEDRYEQRAQTGQLQFVLLRHTTRPALLQLIRVKDRHRDHAILMIVAVMI
jgi:hypothetical protein